MNNKSTPASPRRPNVALWASCAFGSFVVGLSIFAWTLNGILGLAVCLIAALVCLAGAIGGDFIGRMITDPNRVGYEHLLGMLPRMGIPLVVCMIVGLDRGALFAAGLVYYVLVMYPALLGLGTIVTTYRIASPGQSGKEP